MSSLQTAWAARPAGATLIGGALVVLGLILTSVNWWFFVLVAIGGFGPGVLRELGWLGDKDEFQLQAIHRSGYHAYLASGVVAVLLVALFRSSGQPIESPQELATLFLILLCCTSLLSALIHYLGPQRAASRILLLFGLGWLVFAILSNLGSEWTGWKALLLHPLLAAPFLLLAWSAKRFPRISGFVLLATAIFFVQFFGMFRHEHLAFINQAITCLLFIGPLLACAVALLAMRVETDDLN